MDVAFSKILMKNKDSNQKQKNSMPHFQLEQDSIKAKLADTYIFNSSKKNDFPLNVVPKNSFKYQLLKYKRFLIISILFFAFFIFILKELGLQIKFGSEKNIVEGSIGPEEQFIIEESTLLTNLNFYGNASGNSRLTQEYIYLVKEKGSGTAGVDIKLKSPLDPQKGTLMLLAKGELGEEKLVILLKDTSEKNDIKEIRLTPNFGNLTQNWQKIFIPFDRVENKNILISISSIGFEIVDSKKINSKATAYLKDIVLINN